MGGNHKGAKEAQGARSFYHRGEGGNTVGMEIF